MSWFLSPGKETPVLVRVLVVSLLVPFVLFPRLWWPVRDFPLVPAVPIFAEAPAAVTVALSFLGCLFFLFLIWRPRSRSAILGASACWLGLVALDVLRLQALIYLGFLGLISLIWESHGERGRDTLRALLIGLYFWSGLSKLNTGYVEVMFPWLLGPFVEVPSGLVGTSLAVASALVELAAGVFLLFGHTRFFGLILATGLHLTILVLLSPLGTGHQPTVLVWNVCQVFLIWALFHSREPRWSVILLPRSAWGATARALVLLCPALSFFGLWNDLLSFRLYSGAILHANLIVDREFVIGSAVPLESVWNAETGALPIVMWSMRETGYVFASEDYFKKIFAEVCRRSYAGPKPRLILNHSLRYTPGFLPNRQSDETFDCPGVNVPERPRS